MDRRLSFHELAPEAIRALRGLQGYVDRETGLEPRLLELVKMRASQLNGCAYCLDMHSQDARALGETEQRLYTLSAWRETPFFSPRERAALAWAEAVTLLSESRGVADAIYAEALQHFPGKQLVDLTMAIIAINSWNRLAVPFQSEPGGYRPSRM